ncbi:MAG: cysteine hydrolase family protein, partial [Dehalococcoidia bacterium]|nr:cysteine hydrolase family protein [Dehalococcoidia bacterium]
MMKIETTYIKHDYRSLPEVTTEMEINPEKLAFLIIDMQNDFLHPEGMMARKVADIAPARLTITPTKRVAEACRKSGVKVIYTQHNYRQDFSDMGKSWARIYVHRPGTISPG